MNVSPAMASVVSPLDVSESKDFNEIAFVVRAVASVTWSKTGIAVAAV